MRRFAALAPVLVLAACGPRAVLGHGAHEPARAPEYGTPSGAAPSGTAAATPVAGTNLYDPPVDGASILDTPITVVSAASADTPPGEPSPREPRSGIVISRLPAPHLDDARPRAGGGIAAVETPAPRAIAEAFALVGHRDSRESFAFALAVAASLGGAVPAITDGPARSPSADAPAVADGPALVAWAQERASLAPPGAHLIPGDLVVFDRAAAGAPASLVGVVLATDARGVTAFLYLARGVVRIGHLDPARPRVARDREGRTVNSFIRHTADHPPAGTRYLAGELLAGSIRMR